MTTIQTQTQTPDPVHVLERLNRFLVRSQERGRAWSQHDVARAIGRSAALISAFRNGDARGDVPDLCVRLTSFLEQQDAKAQAGSWTLPYVEIRQAQIARECLEYASVHQEIVALIGDSGKGKTMAIRRFLDQHPRTVQLETCKISSPSAVLKDLCLELGESDRGLLRGLLKRIVYRLQDSQRLIIVDDAHTLGPASLDILRTIYDRTGCGMVLSGISLLDARLTSTSPETEQLARRVILRRRLPEYTEADAEQQLTGTFPHLQSAEVLGRFDPLAKSSPARVANVAKLAAKMAGSPEKVQLEHVRTALRQVA